MQQDLFSKIKSGMDIYDVKGDKVGDVDRVYLPAKVTTGAAGATPPPSDQPYIKLSKGPLGLGKDYYIPASAIKDVTDDRVVINVDKDHLDDMGWDKRPDWIVDD